MFRWFKRLVGALVALVFVLILIPVAGLSYGYLTTPRISLDRPAPQPADGSMDQDIRARLAAMGGYLRNEEASFLAYPKQAIVYAAREYANLVARDLPHSFPFWAYIGRFWQDCALMLRATADYPFNLGGHLKLAAIGTGYTIESIIQWSYENTAGRLSAVASGGKRVPEDDFLAGVAGRLASVMDQQRWYDFDYASARGGLLETTIASGLSSLRSLERKAGFSAAYTLKQVYALAAASFAESDAPAEPDINIWANGPVAEAIAGEPETRLLEDFQAQGALFVTQRGRSFTGMLPRLVARGLRFVEIAGNDVIFLTVTTSTEVAAPEGTQLIFAYNLPADGGTRRVGLAAQVNRLHEILPALAAQGARLERIYDY